MTGNTKVFQEFVVKHHDFLLSKIDESEEAFERKLKKVVKNEKPTKTHSD